MRVYSGQFTAADTDGSSEGLQLDCVSERLDTRGAHFYVDGTFTTGNVVIEHNRVHQAASNWFNVTGSTYTANGEDDIAEAFSALRVRTSADFTGTVDWKLIIPERSEVHVG